MPIFHLSSFGERNHAKFTNYLNDTVTLPANSKIALISAQICRNNYTQKITVPANTPMFVRFSCYDIVEIRLNPTKDTTYTVDQFRDAVLALLPNGTAFKRGAEWLVDGDDVDEDKTLRWVNYRMALPAPLESWEKHVMGVEIYCSGKYG